MFGFFATVFEFVKETWSVFSERKNRQEMEALKVEIESLNQKTNKMFYLNILMSVVIMSFVIKEIIQVFV